MNEITREGLKQISYAYGEASSNIFSKLGDTNKNPGALIELESLLAKMRGSTFFYNEDYSSFDDPSFDFVKFSSNDNLQLGLQGAYLTKDYTATKMAFDIMGVGSKWNPSYYGPPSTEGFGTWYYNAWKGYEKEPPALPGFEGGNYSTRYNYEYPVRYTGNPTPYERVCYFEHARWISIYNSGASPRDENDYVYVFELDKDYLFGIQVIDAETDLPQDIRFMYYNKLLQKYVSSTWQPINVNASSNVELSYLSYTIEDNGSSYIFKINIPNDLTFDPESGIGAGSNHVQQTWWHIVMFWGSKDTKVGEDIVAFDPTPTEYNLNSNEVLIWDVKNFFSDNLNSKITWTDHAINDSEVYSGTGQNFRYLVANNRLHFDLKDGYPNALPLNSPYKYNLSDNILYQNFNYSVNSISNDVPNLNIDEFQTAILMVKTYGFEYTSDINKTKGFTNFELKLGPKFCSQEIKTDWADFGYYPEPDQDYLTIAKLILKRASQRTYGSIETNYVNNTQSSVLDPSLINKVTILQNSEIVWIDQKINSFAIKPHGDPLISSILVPALYRNILEFRNGRKEQPALSSMARLLVLASRTPETIAYSSSVLFDPSSSASIIFRRLLKNPVNTLLLPGADEPLAIEFNKNERDSIEKFTGLPPSTEMLRLNSDLLFLKNNKINTANTLEIYQEPSDQCTAADNQTAGNRVGLDYTLRLYLEDQDENVLMKDWFIMASKFLLTTEEYNNRIAKEQTTVGYFTLDTLQNIDEWRLQGYASIVPDLSMGASRVLTTRFVNPPDSTQETEEQFRARYEALGRSQSEIDELVLQFLESGGQFYVVDLFKYDNKFTTVRNAALNITTLTEGIPYWRSNIEDFNNVNQPDPILPSNELYSDSFTISLMGADPLNLEAYGKLANTIYEFTPSSSIVDLTLHTNSTAFKFNSNSGGSVSTIALKLKASLFDPETLLLSNSGIINLKIYSSNADDTAPDELISTSENNYLFTDLENDVYKELYWDINANLLAGTFYWAVVELNSAPQGGDIQLATQTPYDLSSRYLSIQAFSFVNLSDTNIFSCAMPIKVVLSDPNATDIDGLTNTTGTLDIQIYSANDDGTIGSKLVFSSINNSINFTSIKNYDIIFNFDATINLEKNIKYWVLFIPSERQRGGTIQVNLDAVNLNSGLYSQNLTDNSTYSIWDNWDGVNYKAWLKVSEVIPEVYGYFNRDLDYLDAYLPSANTNRITNGLLSKEGSWAFTLKKFPEPSIVTIYPRFSPGFYVPFSRDIYVAIRLMVGGKPKDYYIHLDPTTSPVLPIDINDSLNLADSIAYMYVAKTLEELQNGYHGAPAGDRLVIRST